MDYDKLKNELERDEGRSRKVYSDTAGKLTVGCGWNLSDRGVPAVVIDQLYSIAVKDAEDDARNLFDGFNDLSDARQRCLVNMAFNLGYDRLSKFTKLKAAVEAKDFALAAKEMKSSVWAAQVKGRATRLAEMMENG